MDNPYKSVKVRKDNWKFLQDFKMREELNSIDEVINVLKREHKESRCRKI